MSTIIAIGIILLGLFMLPFLAVAFWKWSEYIFKKFEM